MRSQLTSKGRIVGAVSAGAFLVALLCVDVGTASADPFKYDAVNVRERLRQRFERRRGDGWEVESRARLRAGLDIGFPSLDAATLDADTELRFRVGTFDFTRRLGEAEDYAPGARRLRFRDPPSPDASVTVEVRIRRLPPAGTRLTLKVRARGVPLVSDVARGAESGVQQLTLDAAARLDGTTVNFSGDGPAVIELRTVDVLGETVPLSKIDYFARATPVRDESDRNAPTVTISAPGPGAVLSGDSVALSGTATDDQSIVTVTRRLNDQDPVDVAFVPREGDGGLGSVAADFSGTLVPLVGTNTLTVTARDAAGNTTESTLTFVFSVPRTVQVSVGSGHTMFVTDEGTLYGCGWNAFGQCGDGTQEAKSTPTPVPSLTGVRAVAAGGNHTLVLLIDGSVFAMGDNRWGEVGDGTQETRTTPTPVSGLGSGVVAIAAGPHHSIAVRADGTVWAWGSNAVGLFGTAIGDVNGTIVVPRQVAGVGDAVDVATGVYHSLMLASDGTVWALGSNANGQLGTGGYPTGAAKVPDVSGVTAVRAAAYTSFALHGDGRVTGWGMNDPLLLGPTKSTERNPVPVPDLAGVTSLTSGYFYALFLDADGGVRARGNIGQLFGPTGDFETDTLPTTTALDLLDDVVGAWASDHHAILLRSDGTLWGVGFNNHGQLGNGTKSDGFSTTVSRVLLPE